MNDCLGCNQQAEQKERSFERIKEEAESYAKIHKISLVIYMEGQKWKYINAQTAADLGIPFRDRVEFDHGDHAL